MAVTLTSDPILSEDELAVLMANVTDVDTKRLLINSASAAFKAYTRRLVIINATVDDHQRGKGNQVLYLRATPITNVSYVAKYSGGVLSSTWASDEYQLDTDTGRLALYSGEFPYSEGEANIRCQYDAGWTAGELPGNVVTGAVEYMKFQHNKLDKWRTGIISETFEGHSTSFERGGLPEATKQLWQPYKVFGCF